MISSLLLRLDIWPCDIVVLSFDYGKKLITYKGSIVDPTYLDVTLSGHYKGDAKDFLNRLDDLHLSSWKDVYSGPTSGSVTWRLDYTEDDEMRHLQGKDAFPPEFEGLIALLSELAPEAEEDLAKWTYRAANED